MKDTLTLKPNVVVEARDALTGEVVFREEVHNLVVTAGMNMVRNALYAQGNTRVLTQIGVGVDDTAPTAGDAALGSEAHRAWISQRSADTDAEMTLQAYLGTEDANGVDLCEAGLFEGYTLGYGLLFARAVFTPFAKTTAATMTVTWTIALGVPA